MSHSAGRLKGLNLHHGTLNAVLLPCVLRFNAKAAPAKMQALGEAMGLRKGEEVAGAIGKLNREIGMPAALGEMGIGRDLVEDLVAVALRIRPAPRIRCGDRGRLPALYERAAIG